MKIMKSEIKIYLCNAISIVIIKCILLRGGFCHLYFLLNISDPLLQKDTSNINTNSILMLVHRHIHTHTTYLVYKYIIPSVHICVCLKHFL